MSKMFKMALATLMLVSAQQSLSIAEEQQQVLDADLTAAIESNCQKETANAADPQAAFAQCVEEGKKVYVNTEEKN